MPEPIKPLPMTVTFLIADIFSELELKHAAIAGINDLLICKNCLVARKQSIALFASF